MIKLDGKKYYNQLSMSDLEVLDRSKTGNRNKLKMIKENGEIYLTSKCWANGGSVYRVSAENLANKDMVFKMMYYGAPEVLKYSTDEIQSDCNFMAKTISACDIQDAFPYFNISKMLKNPIDKAVVESVVYNTLYQNPLLIIDYNQELLERRECEKALAGRKKYVPEKDFVMDNDTVIKFALDRMKNNPVAMREFLPFEMLDKDKNTKYVKPRYNIMFQETFAKFFAHNPTYAENMAKELSDINSEAENFEARNYFAGLVKHTEKIGRMQRIAEKEANVPVKTKNKK